MQTSIDLSQAPAWLIALVLACGLIGHLFEHRERPIQWSPADCAIACSGSWTWHEGSCFCLEGPK